MTTEIFYPCGLFHISAPSDCLLKADTLFVGEQSYLWQACCMYCGHLFKLDDVRSSLKADLMTSISGRSEPRAKIDILNRPHA